MHYVYIIQSIDNPDRRYTGITVDLKKRLLYHNSSMSKHTAKLKPWRLETYIAFADKIKAQEFERYLKSGSGRSFAKRHF